MKELFKELQLAARNWKKYATKGVYICGNEGNELHASRTPCPVAVVEVHLLALQNERAEAILASC